MSNYDIIELNIYFNRIILSYLKKNEYDLY